MEVTTGKRRFQVKQKAFNKAVKTAVIQALCAYFTRVFGIFNGGSGIGF